VNNVTLNVHQDKEERPNELRTHVSDELLEELKLLQVRVDEDLENYSDVIRYALHHTPESNIELEEQDKRPYV